MTTATDEIRAALNVEVRKRLDAYLAGKTVPLPARETLLQLHGELSGSTQT